MFHWFFQKNIEKKNEVFLAKPLKMMWQSWLVKQRSPACKFLIGLFKKDSSIFQKIGFKEYNIPVVKIIGTLFAEHHLVALPSIGNQ